MKALTLMWLLAMELTVNKGIMVAIMMILTKRKTVITAKTLFLLSLR